MAATTFSFRFGREPGAPRRRSGGHAFRILALVPLSGVAAHAPTAARRTLHKLDLDSFDDLFEHIRPRVELDLPGLDPRPIVIEPEDLEGFHPSQLLRGVPPLARLLELRARLRDPTRYADAVAELTALSGAVGAPTGAPMATEAAESDAEGLERLLGRRPVAGGASPGEHALDGLIGRIVAADAVPAADPLASTYIAACEERIAAGLRAIVHHPAFQALEAAWRGVWNLATELELDDSLEVTVLDVDLLDLEAATSEGAGPGHVTALQRWLGSSDEDDDTHPWSLVIGHYRFGDSASDIDLLGAIAAECAHAGAPFIGEGSPALLGATEFPSEFSDSAPAPLDPELAERWLALRRSAVGPWIALAMPRVLLRAPYGRPSDPIDEFDFDETGPVPRRGTYLWGNPAVACAILLGRAYSQSGWSLRPSELPELTGLPIHVHKSGGVTRMQPCTEVALTERAVGVLLDAGFVPVVGMRSSDRARVPDVRSIAEGDAPLRGPWQP